MKKTILMALLIIASATVTTATAGKKDKKKKGNTTMLQPVELTNGIDSLSYALGMSQSMGLKKYLATQLKVDTTYIDAFCKGGRRVAGYQPQRIPLGIPRGREGRANTHDQG